MTPQNENICTCGHDLFAHSNNRNQNFCVARKCPCKKFVPQNQSVDVEIIKGKTYVKHHQNQSQGIFDTTDLENEQIKIWKDRWQVGDNAGKVWWEKAIRNTAKETSQRLKAEVEKILDEIIMKQGFITREYRHMILDRVKKRLGIK